jgi:tRNA pseudouridine32 synthase / 23S rRNA pseudouridine746 synthase
VVAQTLKRLVKPSFVRCVPGAWPTVLDFLAERFATQGRAVWLARLQAGLVQTEAGEPLAPEASYPAGQLLSYFRDVPNEAEPVGGVQVLHQDAHLLIADKPHFMPVTPSGQFVRGVLLNVLIEQTGLVDLQPLHRIDSDTAGLVAFAVRHQDRAVYHALFSEHRIQKRYLAITQAPMGPIPEERISRIEPDPAHFMRMHEVVGQANSRTRMQLLREENGLALWRLEPISGKRHQLRVHMNALGLPLLNDGIYPVLTPVRLPHAPWPQPLQLLATELRFIDPMTGASQRFVSKHSLQMAPSHDENLTN